MAKQREPGLCSLIRAFPIGRRGARDRWVATLPNATRLRPVAFRVGGERVVLPGIGAR